MVTILTSPFFTEYVLPFILVFTVVFAILQKSGILGKDKKQIDSIVALSIGLIVISFGNAVGLINSLLPFMAFAMVIILVLLILIAMFEKGHLELSSGLKNSLIGVVVIAVAITVLVSTGAWDYILSNWFGGTTSGEGFANFIFVIIVIGAIAAVSWKKGSSGKSE